MGKSKKTKKPSAQSIRQKIINEANKINPSEFIGDGSLIPNEALKFCCNGEVYTISACSSTSLSKKDKNELFHLLELNQKDQYEASNGDMPWKPKEKYDELFHPTARMLLVYKTNNNNEEDDSDIKKTGEFVGFVHFRFEEDDENDPTNVVLYLYEIQLANSTQGCGLGSHLMRLIELIGHQLKMPMVMLTVFKHNKAALHFYFKLKYVIDETSPSNWDDPDCTYEILSKLLGDMEPSQLHVLSTLCAKRAQRTLPKIIQEEGDSKEEKCQCAVGAEKGAAVVDAKENNLDSKKAEEK